MDFKYTVFLLPGILVGLTVHECCHALTAWKLGDSTARDQGRITLNPLKHIDIMGFVFLLFVGFGWAKPVEFNPAQLKNLRRDRALIAAAGPLSNLVLGVILAFIARAIFFYYTGKDIPVTTVQENFYHVVLLSAYINFILFLFNLIPLPPLDGSHIVFSALNVKPETEDQIRRFGMPLLLVVLIAQKFLDMDILPIGKMAMALMNFILHL
jgi:Zn-dependent protease